MRPRIAVDDHRRGRMRETLREFWETYSIYIMIPISIAAFVTGLYYMLHDTL